MHGDEPAGAEVVEQVRRWPESAWAGCPHGMVLAVGHPDALAAGTRTLPGAPDLNRAFGPEGVGGPVGRRAAELAAALHDVDVLLDLHQTHRPIPTLGVLPDAPGCRELARCLGLEVAVENASLVYGDSMIADHVAGRGGVAVTVELGAVADPACVQHGLGLVRALIREQPSASTLTVWRIESVLRVPGPGMRFTRPLDNGTRVHAGEQLATSPAGALRAPADGAVFLPREDARPGDPAALFARRLS